jgi:hypothetical protein
MTDLYVSWPEYYKKIESLAVQVHQSGWSFNQIVCIAKGGLRVGDTFARLFRQPLAILSASSYAGKNNRLRGQLIFSRHLSMTTETLGDNILLVDDLADSGKTLKEGIIWLNNEYRALSEIRSAVLWYKGSSIFKPDYYVDYLADNPWVHQPFERYEQITLADLSVIVEERK